MQTKHSRGQKGGQAQCKALFFVCLFFFFVFFPLSVPRLVIRRMRKGVAGIGGGERGKGEKRRKKREKRERGEGGGKNL